VGKNVNEITFGKVNLLNVSQFEKVYYFLDEDNTNKYNEDVENCTHV